MKFSLLVAAKLSGLLSVRALDRVCVADWFVLVWLLAFEIGGIHVFGIRWLLIYSGWGLSATRLHVFGIPLGGYLFLDCWRRALVF